MGPTASGKSALAERISAEYDAPIVNADAFQIYRGMDIGTAKPHDHRPYRLLDIKNPNEDFGVGEFVTLASQELQTLFDQGRNAVICGGTGLYVRALLEEYADLMPAPDPALRESLREITNEEAFRRLQKLHPEAAESVDKQNPIRVKRSLERVLANQSPIQFSVPPFRRFKVGIIPTVENSLAKIMHRTEEMLQNGWVAEVNELIENGYGPSDPGFRALGYRAIAEYLRVGGNEGDLIQDIGSDTVKYAKRQRTWLRAEPNLVVFEDATTAWNAVDAFCVSRIW